MAITWNRWDDGRLISACGRFEVVRIPARDCFSLRRAGDPVTSIVECATVGEITRAAEREAKTDA